jgi:polysaccharide pyruvyl transferase CsaB
MSESGRRVLIAGYYGFGNTGDEAILAAMLEDLRALMPELEVCVVSGDPLETRASHGVSAVTFTDLAGIRDAAERADLLILGGGGLFQDHWPFEPATILTPHHLGIAFYAGVPVLATLLDKPLMIYAVGVGPLFSDAARAFTRAAIDQAQVVTVRDAGSLALLEGLGLDPARLRQSADPAFRLVPSSPECVEVILRAEGLADLPRPWAAVALRHWDLGVRPPEWESAVARALDEFADRTGGSIAFVPFQQLTGGILDDAVVMERVAGRMRHAGRTRLLQGGYRPADVAGVLGACDIVVGMRLHAVVFGITTAVPTIGLVYDPKVRTHLAESRCAGLDLAGLEAGRLADLMAQAWGDRESIRPALLDAASRFRQRAEADARLAMQLLSEPTRARRPSGETDALLRRIMVDKITLLIGNDRALAALSDQVAVVRTQATALTSVDAPSAAGLDAARHAEDVYRLERERWGFARHVGLAQALTELSWQIAAASSAWDWAMGRRLRHVLRRVARPDSMLDRVFRAAHAARHGGLPFGTALRGGARRRFRELVCRPGTLAGSLRDRWTQRAEERRQTRVAARAADELARLVARVEGSRGAVVFPPSIGWKVDLFQRPHHLARAFARAGHIAIFDCSNVPEELSGFREIEPNLFLFRGDPERLHRVPRPLIWTFPYNFRDALAFPRPTTILYDWIDDLAVFTQVEPDELSRWHERALKEADLVVTVARTLHERARLVRSDTLYLPNGVEFERFQRAEPPQDPALGRVRADGRPVAGYYGALAHWFDYRLIEIASSLRRDWSFLLIGPDYDQSLSTSVALRRPNVTWLGPRPYSALPGYLAAFDVALIPFLLNDITRATSPLKLYEYFAGGKPVVTTALPECQAYPEVEIAETAERLATALDSARARGRDPGFRERLRAIARANSWEARLADLQAHVASGSSR